MRMIIEPCAKCGREADLMAQEVCDDCGQTLRECQSWEKGHQRFTLYCANNCRISGSGKDLWPTILHWNTANEAYLKAKALAELKAKETKSKKSR